MQRATIRWAVNLDRTPRLIDVRQIGPGSERDISGRCSACGVVLIARLDNRESSNLEALRDRLDKLFARHTDENCVRESAESDPEQPRWLRHPILEASDRNFFRR
jgi:hypothetical protein